VLVEDILTPFDKLYYLQTKDTVDRWYALNEQSAHTRYPVIDEKRHVCGIVTTKDIIGKERGVLIEKIMTKHPLTVQMKTSLAYVAHMMVWEGIEVVPIVGETNTLQGLVSRQDVLRALQQIQRQPQVGDTIDDIVSSNLTAVEDNHTVFETSVIPQMTNQLGTLSNGVFTTLVTEASSRLLLHMKKGNLVLENLTVFFLKPVQIDSQLLIKPTVLEAGRIYAKVDVEILHGQKRVGKALLMGQLIDR